MLPYLKEKELKACSSLCPLGHGFVDLSASLWHLDTGEASGWMNLELCSLLVDLRGDCVSSAGKTVRPFFMGKSELMKNVYLISKDMESPI